MEVEEKKSRIRSWVVKEEKTTQDMERNEKKSQMSAVKVRSYEDSEEKRKTHSTSISKDVQTTRSLYMTCH